MAAPIRRVMTAVKPLSSLFLKQYIYGQAESGRNLFTGNITIQKLQKQCRSITGMYDHLQVLKRHVCYDEREVAITSVKHSFIFDTHALVKKLENSGFASAQAEAIVWSLLQISQATLDHMNKNMVTKSQQEIMLQQLMSHVSSLRKDMIILEKSEFSALKHEYEKQNIEIKQTKQHFEDELTKLKSGVVLDMNLERSRAKEAHSANEQKLAHLVNRFEMGRTESDKHLSMVDNKIDKEIANLLATYERYRNDIMKYAGGKIKL
ncbi:hypothetical protein LSH36_35g07019 [Paralvinella palmiformis]|uniref:Uncharacterized protein n=1 Tax=Paralvinella palmiformis TaxID=53620 RepID=A0AAD9K8T3_9ANNE|nr:hypothetical protein LSH36_35g07019 [Paralvinella palmiformis]